MLSLCGTFTKLISEGYGWIPGIFLDQTAGSWRIQCEDKDALGYGYSLSIVLHGTNTRAPGRGARSMYGIHTVNERRRRVRAISAKSVADDSVVRECVYWHGYVFTLRSIPGNR
jgi:hypothetical protein